MSTTVQLQPGMFSSCDVLWDDKYHGYTPASWEDSKQCCMENCVRPKDTCVDSCVGSPDASKPGYMHRCLRTCEVARQLCLSDCFLNPTNNTYNQDHVFSTCVDKHCQQNATRGYWYDPKCVGDNRDEIIECCKTNCSVALNIDCDLACEWQTSIVEHPNESTETKLADSGLLGPLYLSNGEKDWMDRDGAIGEITPAMIAAESRSSREEKAHDWSLRYILIGIGVAVGMIALFIFLVLLWRWVRRRGQLRSNAKRFTPNKTCRVY